MKENKLYGVTIITGVAVAEDGPNDQGIKIEQ